MLEEQRDTIKQKNNGCYPAYISPVDLAPGCTIVVENQAKINVLSPERPAGMDDGCAFPIEIIQESVMCFEDTKKDDGDENNNIMDPGIIEQKIGLKNF